MFEGVAPRAALVGVKVLPASGTGPTANIVKGVEWAVANRAAYGIEAINLSVGSTGCSDGTDTLSLAVNAAAAVGSSSASPRGTPARAAARSARRERRSTRSRSARSPTWA